MKSLTYLHYTYMCVYIYALSIYLSSMYLCACMHACVRGVKLYIYIYILKFNITELVEKKRCVIMTLEEMTDTTAGWMPPHLWLEVKEEDLHSGHCQPLYFLE